MQILAVFSTEKKCFGILDKPLNTLPFLLSNITISSVRGGGGLILLKEGPSLPLGTEKRGEDMGKYESIEC